jgi:hypothetical protein
MVLSLAMLLLACLWVYQSVKWWVHQWEDQSVQQWVLDMQHYLLDVYLHNIALQIHP